LHRDAKPARVMLGRLAGPRTGNSIGSAGRTSTSRRRRAATVNKMVIFRIADRKVAEAWEV
jgi:hypothetical protein